MSYNPSWSERAKVYRPAKKTAVKKKVTAVKKGYKKKRMIRAALTRVVKDIIGYTVSIKELPGGETGFRISFPGTRKPPSVSGARLYQLTEKFRTTYGKVLLRPVTGDGWKNDPWGVKTPQATFEIDVVMDPDDFEDCMHGEFPFGETE